MNVFESTELLVEAKQMFGIVAQDRIVSVVVSPRKRTTADVLNEDLWRDIVGLLNAHFIDQQRGN